MERKYVTDVVELKKTMIERGVDKLVDLSAKSGVDRNTLSRILSGEAQPSSAVMCKLVDALDMSSDQAGRIFFAPYLRNT